MGLDLRLPIGMMFTFIGALLALYGFFTSGDQKMYQGSLNININLWWGIVLLVFGLLMFALAIYSRAKENKLK